MQRLSRSQQPIGFFSRQPAIPRRGLLWRLDVGNASDPALSMRPSQRRSKRHEFADHGAVSDRFLPPCAGGSDDVPFGATLLEVKPRPLLRQVVRLQVAQVPAQRLGYDLQRAVPPHDRLAVGKVAVEDQRDGRLLGRGRSSSAGDELRKPDCCAALVCLPR